MTQLQVSKRKVDAVKEKGRKKNYHQFNLRDGEWRKQERLLNTEAINSFLEISVRAAACPMPFNMDIWDGLLCVAEGQRVQTSDGKVPIEKVKACDVVWTFNEEEQRRQLARVTQISNTIRKNLVEVETEEGTIRLTEDHRVLTQRGWIPAGQLTEEDLMYVW